MIQIVLFSVIALAVPAWVCWKYEEPKPLTWPVALRYLLMCAAVFLLALLAMGDPLLCDWYGWMLVVSVLFLAALVIVLGDSVGYEHKTKRH